MTDLPDDPTTDPRLRRREFIRRAGIGAAIVALGGGLYYFSDSAKTREARAQSLADGRPRLPAGQRVIERLRPMGGTQGDPSLTAYSLRVEGAVDAPITLRFTDLAAIGTVEQKADVHCVTGWSVLDALWTGVRMDALAARVKVRPNARHVIFEAVGGYTTNVPIAEALAPDAMVVWKLDGETLAGPHGAPVRGLIPSLYFWKSAKWLTAIRFSENDEPGFWETRGYHNHADPWREERYSA